MDDRVDIVRIRQRGGGAARDLNRTSPAEGTCGEAVCRLAFGDFHDEEDVIAPISGFIYGDDARM